MLRSEKSDVPFDSLLAPEAQRRLAGGGASRGTTGSASPLISSPERATDQRASVALSGLADSLAMSGGSRFAPPPANLHCASGAQKLLSLAVKSNHQIFAA
jgi:hypothetical protein